ncbi:MAG: glycerol-3-phosphate dehydrogenase/oxidase [Saprospiraceae bacterium]|nr:glycerol-3-phosphate dehydrogenase/oxidase [Saprospiraceae bacterium]MBP7679528.1 glycerol-3-phosphate dehydrogenase/oxidase [Saprospiraceae bacterium]
MRLVRSAMLQQLQEVSEWDIVIIGGGATGMGAAVDAASRGLKTLLVERYDFGKGTSGRSTKLVHGGVRYLAQGNIKLVFSALRERGYLLKNAPHLARILPFIVPVYSWWAWAYYTIGLVFYDLLSGNLRLGRTQILRKKTVLQYLPLLKNDKLKGGILYYDGQFDDTRLLIDLAKTATQHHACILNYCEATTFIKIEKRIKGVVVTDKLSNAQYTINAKTVINATGVFAEALMRKDAAKLPIRIAPSQGVHFVLPQHFFKSQSALMIPKTADGRVLFAVPWLGHFIVGTTDTPVKQISVEPRPLPKEIDYLLSHISLYFGKPCTGEDVQSVYVGLRPLVRSTHIKNTKLLPRDHTIMVSKSNLITITGGKWTTYRKMAEQVINKAIAVGNLSASPCMTATLPIYQTILPTGNTFADDLPYSKETIAFIIENEMVATIEDVLSHRTRILLLNARLAIQLAPIVADQLATELSWDAARTQKEIATFENLAKQYMLI